MDKDVYTCNWSEFRTTLAAAKTVSVQSDPMDRYTDDQLARLGKRLGKTVVQPSEEPVDLQFLLVPLNNTGAFMGPAEQDRSTLRIYAGSTKTHRGRLVWAERYRGPSDMAWPAIVHYTLEQFEERLKTK